MPDKKKVKKGLEICTAPTEYGKGGNRCCDCPYFIPRDGFNQFRCDGQQMMKDALELLTEQDQLLNLQHESLRGSSDTISYLFHKIKSITDGETPN